MFDHAKRRIPMTFTLSSRDVSQLQAAMEAILSPIEQSSPQEWGVAVMREVKALLQADQALFALPLDGSIHIIGDGERTEEAIGQYEADYWRTDLVIGKRRKALGLSVHHQDDLYLDGELEKDMLYNEWCVPNKLFDTLGMAVDVSNGPIPAGVNVYRNRSRARRFGEKGKALMHLLLPAFKASVLSYGTLVGLRNAMTRMVDEIPVGACIFDRNGDVLHQNLALGIYYSEEREADALRSLVMRVGKSLASGHAYDLKGTSSPTLAMCCEQLHTISNSYLVRGSFLGCHELPDAAAIVVVEIRDSAAMRRRKSAEKVRSQFRLTHREIETALLLAQRMRADEIAKTLGISPHTARHHTENVFIKTGVTSRDEVASLFEERIPSPLPSVSNP